MRPIIVPTDYEGPKDIFHLHNGDWPVTLVLDSKERIFVAVSGSSEPCSCLWNNQVVDGPLGMLVAVNVKILHLSFKLLSQQAYLSMDVLDAWQCLCEKLAPLQIGDPIQELLQMIDDRITRIQTHESYLKWSGDPLNRDRWAGLSDERRFMLDMLGPLIGSTLLKHICTRMGISPPRPPSLKTLGLLEPSSTTESEPPTTASMTAKKSKLALGNTKGHRSLTSFFTMKSK